MLPGAHRWRSLCLALAIAVLFGVLAAHRLHDNDLFWHLAFGRALAETQRLVVAEPLTLPELGSTVLVHQWPWDYVLYRVEAAYGFRGVGILVVGLAAVAGAGLTLLAASWSSARPRITNVLAAVLVTAPLVVTRLNERPETVTAVFWPLGLLLARSVARPSDPANPDGGRARAVRAVLLVLLTSLWAQTHLSVLVFLAAGFIVIAPACLGGPGRGTRVGVLGSMTVAALLNPFAITSAKGYHLLATVQHPVGGYINEHIAEWKPLEWRMLDPTDPQNLQGPAYGLLLVVVPSRHDHDALLDGPLRGQHGRLAAGRSPLEMLRLRHW